jgi:hypothetical protein
MPKDWLMYAIIGGVVILFFFLLMVGGVVFFIMKKRKAKQQAAQQSAATPAVEESHPSYELQSAPARYETPEAQPVWGSQSPQAETPVKSASYSMDPEPYTASQQSASPFAAPPQMESAQQPTGPFSSPTNTTPPSAPSYPTSPNIQMHTSANLQNEMPIAAVPPVASSPAEIPVIEDSGVTMDLSTYKQIIEEQTKPKSPGSIVFTSGALEGKTFEIPPDGLFIGRDSHASQIVIPDPRVSKSHLWMGWKNGKVTIVDQESRNGTFVNDIASQKITETEIHNGDVIILGEANVASFEFRASTS